MAIQNEDYEIAKQMKIQIEYLKEQTIRMANFDQEEEKEEIFEH